MTEAAVHAEPEAGAIALREPLQRLFVLDLFIVHTKTQSRPLQPVLRRIVPLFSQALHFRCKSVEQFFLFSPSRKRRVLLQQPECLAAIQFTHAIAHLPCPFFCSSRSTA